jgi:hypothetical protein
VPAQTRISASWKNVDSIYTKIGGSWKNVEAAYTKVGGDWKQFFSSAVALTVNYLVIAGGGGGAANAGGGGGAGGYRTSAGTSGGGASAESSLSLAASINYTVTIGAGGNGAALTGNGSTGSNSVFATITSNGGGGGGQNNTAGSAGGSGGGGGGFDVGAGGNGTANQGYSGGAGNLEASGGGGGGAGESGNTDAAGFGGDGVASSITGTSVTRAGGGGGAERFSGSKAGGDGGGGAGGVANSTNGSPGTTNTGGGGGGGWQSGSRNGGNGGSGLVIIRYPNTYAITGGTGLTFTTTTVGSDKVTTFTAGTGNIQFIQPTQDYQLLETVVLSSSQASVEFTNLATKYAADYQHLQIRVAGRSDRAETITGLRMQLGVSSIDTSTNYANHQLYGYNGSVSSGGFADTAFMFASSVAGGNAPTSVFGAAVIDCLDFFETSKNKTIRALGGAVAGTGTNAFITLESGHWRNTAAVGQIRLILPSGNFVQYSRFSLYGLR